MGDSLDGVDVSQPEEEQTAAIVELPKFIEYLRNIIWSTLNLQDDDVTQPTLKAELEDRSNQECIKKFLNDPQVSSLFIQRSLSKGIFTSIITYFEF